MKLKLQVKMKKNHLFDKYIDFKKNCELERKKEKKEAIFPCNLRTVCLL